eukprot:TRINITY_DN109837_c0_g1_i1.p1 TRINITY_DN109837_c0_g1~~TRINITY_DN109837_c0_g1_i1.p1  ORF type:complete len:210 (+),score=42.20 TRINITY_DN109837_c0_g1_i1:68-697(+)
MMATAPMPQATCDDMMSLSIVHQADAFNFERGCSTGYDRYDSYENSTFQDMQAAYEMNGPPGTLLESYDAYDYADPVEVHTSPFTTEQRPAFFSTSPAPQVLSSAAPQIARPEEVLGAQSLRVRLSTDFSTPAPNLPNRVIPDNEPMKVQLPAAARSCLPTLLNPQLPAKKMPVFAEEFGSGAPLDPNKPAKKRLPGHLLPVQRAPAAR